MRLISPREYARIKKIRRVSTVYERIRRKELPCVEGTMVVKRIPFDDETGEAVNGN